LQCSGSISSESDLASPARPFAASQTDRDFWSLIDAAAESTDDPRLFARYTSNEMEVAALVSLLERQRIRGGGYLGVGLEQNFSYIAAIRPSVAFILDISRRVFLQQLMFKGLFELAGGRVDFASLLFCRPKPLELGPASSIDEIWASYSSAPFAPDLCAHASARVLAHLTDFHRFPLSAADRMQLLAIHDAFGRHGPDISRLGRDTTDELTDGDATTLAGQRDGWRTFLSTENNFHVVRTLHVKNLIVPIVGDFAGPHAVRHIGEWLRQRDEPVTAFYVSNVEGYLFANQRQNAFYENVESLPLVPGSVFVRSYSFRKRNFRGLVRPLCPIPEFLTAARGARRFSYNSVLACRP